jgi:phage gpG-like protein
MVTFRQSLPGAQLKGLQRGLNWGVKEIALRMDVKGLDPIEDPPNAPPGPIAVRKGKLRRGLVTVGPSISGTTVKGGIAVRGVLYAAIQEFGGTTRPHVILPRKAKALAFAGAGGGTVFAMRVFHPGSVIPARPYIRPVIPEIRDRCMAEMKREIGKYGQKCFGTMWKGLSAA